MCKNRRVRIRFTINVEEQTMLAAKQLALGCNSPAEVIRRALAKLYDDIGESQFVLIELPGLEDRVEMEAEADASIPQSLSELMPLVKAQTQGGVIRIAIRHFCQPG
jgi:hypothetical protein